MLPGVESANRQLVIRRAAPLLLLLLLLLLLSVHVGPVRTYNACRAARSPVMPLLALRLQEGRRVRSRPGPDVSLATRPFPVPDTRSRSSEMVFRHDTRHRVKMTAFERWIVNSRRKICLLSARIGKIAFNYELQ